MFFLVAALVFAGLGWVTYSALGVERAQREAAAQAELGNNLRVALWRLDGRMLPALGVEDSRALLPLRSADPAVPAGRRRSSSPRFPTGCRFHFQLDPVNGWSSPQVLDDRGRRTAFARRGPTCRCDQHVAGASGRAERPEGAVPGSHDVRAVRRD